MFKWILNRYGIKIEIAVVSILSVLSTMFVSAQPWLFKFPHLVRTGIGLVPFFVLLILHAFAVRSYLRSKEPEKDRDQTTRPDKTQ